MSFREKLADNFIWIVLGAVLFMLLAAIIIIWRSLPPTEFTILTGREGGAYYNAGLAYQTIAEEKGFTLNVEPTAGSVVNLQKLKDGEASVALVQGGIADPADGSQLSTLASVYYEPVWIFFRKDMPGGANFKHIDQLVGRRIAIGEVGSGGEILATDLLTANGLDETNTTILRISPAEAVERLAEGNVDAGFFVAGPTASTIQEMMRNSDLELMDVENADAYRSRFPFLTYVTLPAGSIDLPNRLPEEPKRLIATAANIVVRNDIHPDLIRLMTIAAVQTHEKGGLFEQRYEFPNYNYADLPIGSEERAYLDRVKQGDSALDNYLPFWAAALVDRFLLFLLPIAVIILPLLGKSPMLYTIYNKRKVTRWYREVREIDMRVPKMSLDESDVAIKKLDELDIQLQERMRLSEGYMAAFYELRTHIDVVRERVNRRRAELRKLASAEQGGIASGEKAKPAAANAD